MRVKIDTTRVNHCFLTFLLNCTYGKTEIAKHRKTSAGQHTINQDGLGKIKIPVPPFELQSKFVVCLSNIEKQKKLLIKSMLTIDNLFASLQHRAFRGEL
jgi:restriction endonuclease S subunit